MRLDRLKTVIARRRDVLKRTWAGHEEQLARLRDEENQLTRLELDVAYGGDVETLDRVLDFAATVTEGEWAEAEQLARSEMPAASTTPEEDGSGD